MHWLERFLVALLVVAFVVYSLVIATTRYDLDAREARTFSATTQKPIPRSAMAVYREEYDVDCSELTTCKLDDPESCRYCARGDYECTQFLENVPVMDDNGEAVDEIPKNANRDEGYCMKSASKCNPRTSNVMYVKQRDESFATVCFCKYPHLVTGSSYYSDCDVVKACGEGGTLLPKWKDKIDFDPLKEGTCSCPAGKIPFKDSASGPSCVPLTIKDRPPCHEGTFDESTWSCTCPPQYVSSRDWRRLPDVGYDASTIASFFYASPQCLKLPCKWDASSSGRGVSGDEACFNENNRFVRGYGCACDYRNGWVGVLLEDHESASLFSRPLYKARHYNACVKVAKTATLEVPHRSVTSMYRAGGARTYHRYAKTELQDRFLDLLYKLNVASSPTPPASASAGAPVFALAEAASGMSGEPSGFEVDSDGVEEFWIVERWYRANAKKYSPENYFNIRLRALPDAIYNDRYFFLSDITQWPMNVAFDPETNRDYLIHNARENVSIRRKILSDQKMLIASCKCGKCEKRDESYNNIVCEGSGGMYAGVFISNPEAASGRFFTGIEMIDRGTELRLKDTSVLIESGKDKVLVDLDELTEVHGIQDDDDEDGD